jgi:hypothetical protein
LYSYYNKYIKTKKGVGGIGTTEKNFTIFICMKLYENIRRIKTLMETKSEFNIVKEDNYTNKYGENIDMIETEDGDVYIKHEDYKNNFIKLDNLFINYDDQITFFIVLHQEEKEFISNFLLGTKYEYLIPHFLK